MVISWEEIARAREGSKVAWEEFKTTQELYSMRQQFTECMLLFGGRAGSRIKGATDILTMGNHRMVVPQSKEGSQEEEVVLWEGLSH